MISRDLPWWRAFTLARLVGSQPVGLMRPCSSLAHLMLVTHCPVPLGQKSPEKEFRTSLYMYVCVSVNNLHQQNSLFSECNVHLEGAYSLRSRLYTNIFENLGLKKNCPHKHCSQKTHHPHENWPKPLWSLSWKMNLIPVSFYEASVCAVVSG